MSRGGERGGVEEEGEEEAEEEGSYLCPGACPIPFAFSSLCSLERR